MSETTVGREPVQLLEIVVPRCANIHGQGLCAATETGDQKCFNTRSTCNAVANYQARPLSHLNTNILAAQGESGAQLQNGGFVYSLVVDLTIPGGPTGVIWSIGDGGANFYVGFLNPTTLIARCGFAGAQTGPTVARVAVDVTQYLGGRYSLIAVASRNAGVNQTIKLYLFCQATFCLMLLGEHTSSGDAGSIFGTGNFGCGVLANAGPIGETVTPYTGTIYSARLHTNQTDTLYSGEDKYRTRYFFDDGRKAKPSDDIYIMPALVDVQTVGTKLNLTGADGRYEPLGRRAFLSAQIADFPHTDFLADPYLSDRTYDPLDRSTFWTKWMLRNKFGKTRAIVRIYTGYNGQPLADMEKQTYVLGKLTWSNRAVNLEARDFLSLTEFSRAQVPAPSSGKLFTAITETTGSFTVLGDVTNEYPNGGTLRIGDELLTFSSRAYDAVSGLTTFSSLTRGTDGSTASAHAAGESVQFCRRYVNNSVYQILFNLLVDDAEIPLQYINNSKMFTEDQEHLDFYRLSTIISEPTGIDTLIGELAEQCSFYLWWNERDQVIDMQAIRPLDPVTDILTADYDIVGDSLSVTEQPDQRVTTISFFFNPRNFAGDLRKPVNYRNQLIISNAEAQSPDQYGRLPQLREIFSRWILTEALANQTTSRFVRRYYDVPQYVKFYVDAKDRHFWVGDYIRIRHPYYVDARGEENDVKRFLIIEANEVEAGHMQMLECIDVTLDGLLYRITVNGLGTYTPELFALNNAFITDNNGLNPDGTTGATIS